MKDLKDWKPKLQEAGTGRGQPISQVYTADSSGHPRPSFPLMLRFQGLDVDARK